MMTQDEAKAAIAAAQDELGKASHEVLNRQREVNATFSTERSVEFTRHYAAMRDIESRRAAAEAPFKTEQAKLQADVEEQTRHLWEAAAGVKVGDRVMMKLPRHYPRGTFDEREAVVVTVKFGVPAGAWVTKKGEPSKAAGGPNMRTHEWRKIEEPSSL